VDTYLSANGGFNRVSDEQVKVDILILYKLQEALVVLICLLNLALVDYGR